MDRDEFLTCTRLDEPALDAWIEAGWLVPPRPDQPHEFSDVDAARVQLIIDLRKDVGVNDHGISVVLDLIDQIHGLRRALDALLTAVRTQPASLRKQIADAVDAAELDPHHGAAGRNRGRDAGASH
jgi:chaperone modulatory protein CbpM